MFITTRRLAVTVCCLVLFATWQTVQACTPDIYNEIVVSTSGSCTDIQTAIDATDGISPYTITVLAGAYTITTPLVLKSNIQISGAGAGATILEKGNGEPQLISMHTVDNVTITGFTLNGGGIDATTITNTSITNNFFNDAKYGIYAFKGAGLSVTSNTFNNNFIGIAIEETDTTLVENNLINGGTVSRGNGMYLSDTFINVINNDILNSPESGIVIGYGDYTITGNTISGCGMQGIHTHEHNPFKTAAPKIISGNTIACTVI
jgi:parallel beta-helix repeat protein